MEVKMQDVVVITGQRRVYHNQVLLISKKPTTNDSKKMTKKTPLLISIAFNHLINQYGKRFKVYKRQLSQTWLNIDIVALQLT